MVQEVTHMNPLFLHDMDGHDDVEFIDQQPNTEIISETDQILIEFQQNARLLVAKHIANYFKDKHLHIGGSIPSQFLTSDKRISMVLNYTISNAVDCAYEVLGNHDTEKVIDLLHGIARAGVPKEFAGGILCIHLELVEGVKIDQKQFETNP